MSSLNLGMPRVQSDGVGMSLRVLRSHGRSLGALAREFGLNWRTM